MRIRLAVTLVVSGLAGSGMAHAGVVSADAGTAAQSAGACSLLAPQEIKQVLGSRVPPLLEQMPPSEERLPRGGSECFYPGITIQLNALPYTRFEEARRQHATGGRTTVQPEGGLGDEAFSYEEDAGQDSHTVVYVVRSGQHVVIVTMDVTPPETGNSRRPDAQAVARAAVAKLR